MRWTAGKGGVPFPRLLGRSQRSRVVEATTRPAPPRNLCPTAHKGAPSNRGTTMLESPPRQRQRWGEKSQSPHHPRLCVNLPCNLIGGSRKKGGPGGRQHGERGPRAEVRPVAPPGASLASFWAPRKKLAAAAAKYPRPAPQAPTHRALVRWTAEEGGTPLPRLLPCSQRSRVVEVTTCPAQPRNLCPTAHKGAPVNKGTTIMENHPGSGSGGRGNINPHTTRAFASTCHTT